MVADIVDAAKHVGTNIMTLWSSKKLALSSCDEAMNVFFVRVPAEEKDAAVAAFGNVKEVKAEGVTGEFAFVTEKMTEAAFIEKSAKVTVKNRIRVEA